jgi:hypothetical protein
MLGAPKHGHRAPLAHDGATDGGSRMTELAARARGCDGDGTGQQEGGGGSLRW